MWFWLRCGWRRRGRSQRLLPCFTDLELSKSKVKIVFPLWAFVLLLVKSASRCLVLEIFSLEWLSMLSRLSKLVMLALVSGLWQARIARFQRVVVVEVLLRRIEVLLLLVNG